MGSKDSQSLSRPQAIAGAPHCDVDIPLLHILPEISDVGGPDYGSALVLQVLLENRGPLLAGDLVSDILLSLRIVHGLNRHFGGDLHIPLQLLESLVVGVVKRSTIKIDDTSAPVHVVDGSCESNLGSETVTSERRHSELLLVHKLDHVARNVLQLANKRDGVNVTNKH